jgi:hypothetical protein
VESTPWRRKASLSRFSLKTGVTDSSFLIP